MGKKKYFMNGPKKIKIYGVRYLVNSMAIMTDTGHL